jgi:hypothetical protein
MHAEATSKEVYKKTRTSFMETILNTVLPLPMSMVFFVAISYL